MPYPTNAVDAEVWSILVQAQRAILSATQFVVEFNTYMERKENMPFMSDRMKELDSLLEPLTINADGWSSDSTRYDISEPEAVVARSMRLMAKIKLNRYVTYSPQEPLNCRLKIITVLGSRCIDTAL